LTFTLCTYMLIYMRTTIVLDDRLARDAKRLAAQRGITLSDLVAEAIRAVLAEPAGPVPRFSMVTYGGGEPVRHHEPGDLSEALEDEERRSLPR
jgi:hypothetical protein